MRRELPPGARKVERALGWLADATPPTLYPARLLYVACFENYFSRAIITPPFTVYRVECCARWCTRT